MIVLGIDPGLATTGWGVVVKEGSSLRMVDYGCIETLAGTAHADRLYDIHLQLAELIKRFKPELMSIEELFFYKNVKTATKVGEARGVMLLTAAQLKVPLKEFTPLQIKQAITSYGRADKNQIQQMIKMILELKEIPKPDDAADALAIAVTCLQSINSRLPG